MEKKNWFVHVEWVVVLITLLGGFYKMDSKIDSNRQEMSVLYAKESQRTDRLYEMFYELIKETRGK